MFAERDPERYAVVVEFVHGVVAVSDLQLFFKLIAVDLRFHHPIVDYYIFFHTLYFNEADRERMIEIASDLRIDEL